MLLRPAALAIPATPVVIDPPEIFAGRGEGCFFFFVNEVSEWLTGCAGVWTAEPTQAFVQGGYFVFRTWA